jgi:hypothetical protein
VLFDSMTESPVKNAEVLYSFIESFVMRVTFSWILSPSGCCTCSKCWSGAHSCSRCLWSPACQQGSYSWAPFLSVNLDVTGPSQKWTIHPDKLAFLNTDSKFIEEPSPVVLLWVPSSTRASSRLIDLAVNPITWDNEDLFILVSAFIQPNNLEKKGKVRNSSHKLSLAPGILTFSAFRAWIFCM